MEKRIKRLLEEYLDAPEAWGDNVMVEVDVNTREMRLNDDENADMESEEKDYWPVMDLLRMSVENPGEWEIDDDAVAEMATAYSIVMKSDYGKQVVCMIKADGNKDAFVVVANKGCTVDDIIKRLIAGEKNMSPYESGSLVTGEWRDKLLHEYWDTMENEYEPGGWEYPGIYVPGTRKIPRFSKDAYQPHYILGRWYGNANELC